MERMDPRSRRMLRQADQVAEIGKRPAAEGLYRDLVKEYPKLVPGWLGLASVVLDDAEKRSIYEHVLTLDPTNETALSALGQEAAPETAAPVAESATQPASDDDEKTVTDVIAQIKADAAARQRQREQDAIEGATRSVAKSAETPAPAPVVEPVAVETPDETLAACYRHPGRETGLRCNRCGKPICTECATPTPVGYRCPECIRETEASYFTANPLDYIIAAIVAIPLSTIAAYVMSLIGFWLLLFFIAPAAGTLIGTLVFRAVGRRRGRYLAHLLALCIVFGAAIAFLLRPDLFSLGLYAVFAASAAFYRLRA